MDGLNLSRQVGIVAPHLLRTPVTVIGAGGLGSALLLQLAKMGCTALTVYDADGVEEHNVANQIYRLEDVGRPKAVAAGEVAQSFAGTAVTIRPERWIDQQLSGIVCVCVDTMEARAAVWRAVRYKATVPLLLEGRMGGTFGNAYGVRPFDPDDVAFYEAMLYQDGEADDDPCTARAIIFNVFAITSWMCNLLAAHLTGRQYPRETSFDLEAFSVETRW